MKENKKILDVFSVDSRNPYAAQDGSTGQPGMELALTDQNRYIIRLKFQK
jgi:hypothetical protein